MTTSHVNKHLLSLIVALFAFIVPASSTIPAEAQQTTLSYLYDDLGRLSKVIDGASGQCAVYEYDATGNILSISRQANCITAPVITSNVPGATANCFVVTGQGLFGATVSVDTPGVSVTGLKASDTSLSFCLSTPAAVCSLSLSVTVSTLGGSSAALSVTISGAAALRAGMSISGSIDAVGQSDRFCFSLPSPDRVLLQATSNAMDPCLLLLDGASGSPVTGGLACGFPTARLDLVLPAGSYIVEVSDNSNDQTGAYTLFYQPMVIADSVSDFSCTQGQHNWQYGYYDGPFTSSNFKEMTSCLPNDTWYGGEAWWVDPALYWTSIRAAVSFPNGPTSCGRQNVEHWAVRRWVSEVTGTVTIRGTVANVLSGSDFTGLILVDGEEKLRQPVASTEEMPYTLNDVSVSVGSVVDFAIIPGASDCNDHARFTATISGAH
jgi:hypothetical protein